MNLLQHTNRNRIRSAREKFSAPTIARCVGVSPLTSHGNEVLKFAGIMLLFATVFLSGCASIMLGISNEEFESRNQRQIDFSAYQVEADYLGKRDGAYVYKAIDSNKYEVTFRLPAENGKQVEIDLDSFKGFKPAGDSAIFYFVQDDHQQFEIENIANFPQNIYVSRKNVYHYSCTEGAFTNSLAEKKGYGLTAFDSFLLGLRRTGYCLTVPLDVAVTAPVMPLILIILWNWNPI